MQAELARAGDYVGVVTLTEDGVKVDLEDPALQEQVVRAFRDAGPVEYAAGHGERGDVRWEEFSHFGDRVWFEKVLRSLDSAGYSFHTTKTDSG
ncbi:MAG: hypothetical protein ACXWZU_03355 [Actinomycetota bacterium]